MIKEKSKILFIHPPAYTHKKIDAGLKYPPMGIAFLAATAREAGYPIKIFDANVENEPFTKIKKILNEYKPKIVGISFTSLLAESAHEVAGLVKQINKNTVVIAGGYHPTVKPLEIISDDNFDFVIVGEGELTFIEWLKNYETGQKDYSQIRGLVFKRNQEVIQTSPRELITNLDVLPFPAYDLLPVNRYSSLASTRKPFITFIRSRGCPFYCIFCGVQKMFTRHYRCQSPEKTISEIDKLVKDFQIREINFKDSDFLIDKENVKKLCELLIAKNYDLIWTCNARVDMVNEEILPLMKKAGCSLITFGVESGSQEILDNLKKGTTIEQIKKAARLVQQFKIKYTFDIILGGIGESRQTFEQTLNLLKELSPDYVHLAFLTAFPGSELYDEAIRNNWFLGGKAEDYNYEELQINATKISNKELAKTYQKAFISFYFRPRYILKRLKYFTWSEFKNNLKGLWFIIRSILK